MFDSVRFLQEMPMLKGRFHYTQALASSNDTAAELVRNGAESGTLVLAESQTKGRGRGGNSWSCPQGQGLLFSLVIEPDVEKSCWPRMALAAGLAVVGAVRQLGLPAEIKWPNDVWVNGKKCAGVLVEGCEDKLVVGIGLNVSVTCFPEEIAGSATSLWLEGLAGVDRELLLAATVRGVFQWASLCGSHFDKVVESVNAHCALRGSMIQLRQSGQMLSGRMVGVNNDGHLLLENDKGINAVAQADEVRVIAVG